MKRKYLYRFATLIWGVPGIFITIKGIKAYCGQPHCDLRWLLLISAGILVAFMLMFRRIVNRYSARIESLEGKLHLWQTFPLRGWILILFMMGLGMALRFIPDIPSAFTASFYSGLGPALMMAAARFAANAKR